MVLSWRLSALASDGSGEPSRIGQRASVSLPLSSPSLASAAFEPSPTSCTSVAVSESSNIASHELRGCGHQLKRRARANLRLSASAAIPRPPALMRHPTHLEWSSVVLARSSLRQWKTPEGGASSLAPATIASSHHSSVRSESVEPRSRRAQAPVGELGSAKASPRFSCQADMIEKDVTQPSSQQQRVPSSGGSGGGSGCKRSADGLPSQQCFRFSNNYSNTHMVDARFSILDGSDQRSS